jgi:DNA-binding transcriptional MerR regulator
MTQTARHHHQHPQQQAAPRERYLRIGEVVRRLRDEFPDVSISKVRYLEDEGLIQPRRTQGGYRLFSASDLERLRTILRLQRDEFLPLRVIRQVIAQGRSAAGTGRRPRLVGGQEDRLTFDQLLAAADADPAFVRELEEFQLIERHASESGAPYSRTDVEIVIICQRLARYGVAARHLKAFRSAVEREAGLLEQIMTPALRSHNPERREAGLQELEALAELTSQLAHLLLVRDLRDLAR